MPAVSKACDACRVRRTKCSGVQPCPKCEVSGIRCTFEMGQRKRGPAGKTVSRLRSSQSAGSGSASPMMTALVLGNSPRLAIDLPFGQLHHSKSSYLNRIDDILQQSLDDYFRLVYSLCPVIIPETVKARFNHKEHLHNKPFAALILSLAALPIMLSSRPSESGSASSILEEAIILHNDADLGSNPTLETIATSISLGSALRIKKGFNAYFMRHREAIALTDLLKLKNLESHQNLTKEEKQIAVNIYWLLAATERSNSLLQCRSISLHGRLSHLAQSLDPENSVSLRLAPCTRLFEVMDESIIDCVNWTCTRPLCGFNAIKAAFAYAALAEIELDGLLSPVQIADFLITRQFLHAKIWQACVVHSCIEFESSQAALRMEYPLAILKQTVDVIDLIPFSAIQGNGQAMAAKLQVIVQAAESVMSLPAQITMPDGVFSVEYAYELLERVRDTATQVGNSPWMRWEAE